MASPFSDRVARSIAIHLLLANESWRRCDREAKILSPHGAVELDVCLINLSIIAKNKDVESLNWCGAWEQDESPSPCNDVAVMPDVESGDLIDAIARVSMASLNRSKVGLANRSVWCASEEVDAVGDLLVAGVGNRLDEGVEGGGLIAVRLLRLDEGVDDGGSLMSRQTVPWLPALKVGDDVGIGSRSGNDGCCSHQRENDSLELHLGKDMRKLDLIQERM